MFRTEKKMSSFRSSYYFLNNLNFLIIFRIKFKGISIKYAI